MIVARHDVPGSVPPKEPSRRVRYDRAANPGGVPRRKRPSVLMFDVMDAFLNTDFFCFHIRNVVIPILQSPNRSATHLQESDRTLRDGSFGAHIPGTSCQA